MFWLGVYLLLDWGSIAPLPRHQCRRASGGDILQRLPDHEKLAGDWWMHKWMCTGLWLLLLLPLIFGGKIYNSLKILMSFKLIAVIGFLAVSCGVSFFHRQARGSWLDIITGAVQDSATYPSPASEVKNVFFEVASRAGGFPKWT